MALDGFADPDSRSGRISEAVKSLTELAGLASAHDIRLGLEPVCFSRFRRLDEVLEVVEAVGTDKVGLVLDTFHVWASRWPVRALGGIPPQLVVCVQIGDAVRSPQPSDADRNMLPGDGAVPIAEMIGAIRESGYAGPWTAEVHAMDLPGGADSTASRLFGKTVGLLLQGS